MTQEDYVSYEVAQLLKEKGFDWECLAHWFVGTERNFSISKTPQNWNEVKTDLDWLSCPTHQMACNWLREKHQLHISVDVSPLYGKTKDEKGRNTCGLLYWHYMASGEWMNEKYNPFQKAFVVSAESNEQAIEKALRHSLENLI